MGAREHYCLFRSSVQQVPERVRQHVLDSQQRQMDKTNPRAGLCHLLGHRRTEQLTTVLPNSRSRGPGSLGADPHLQELGVHLFWPQVEGSHLEGESLHSPCLCLGEWMRGRVCGLRKPDEFPCCRSTDEEREPCLFTRGGCTASGCPPRAPTWLGNPAVRGCHSELACKGLNRGRHF